MGRISIWVSLAVLLLALPWASSGYVVFLACLCGVNIVATLGLNITTGYTGLLSLSHAGFVAVGAYTTALLSNHWGVSILVCILLSGVMASLVGGIFGLPSFRLKGIYLAVATLAAQYTIIFALRQGGPITGGDSGLVVSIPQIGGLALDTNQKFYFVVLAVTVLAIWISRNLFFTRIGRAFIAIRERDFTAEVFGINLMRYKALAFMIGAFYAGVAGSLLAGFMRVVTPEQFSLTESVFYLAAVVVGGAGSIAGSIIGAVFMTLIPEFIAFALESTQEAFGFRAIAILGSVREIVFGGMIVAFLVFEPRGLSEVARRIWARLKRTKSSSSDNAHSKHT
jgi:branched-chain amino acid transport system permease protein